MCKTQPVVFVVLGTLVLMATAVGAQTPEGVELKAWAKVEAQLATEGLHPVGAGGQAHGLGWGECRMTPIDYEELT